MLGGACAVGGWRQREDNFGFRISDFKFKSKVSGARRKNSGEKSMGHRAWSWRLEERFALGWRQGKDNFGFRIADCEFKSKVSGARRQNSGKKAWGMGLQLEYWNDGMVEYA